MTSSDRPIPRGGPVRRRPPAAPSDPRPGVVVSGRVVAVHAPDRRDVLDDDGQAWSLLGTAEEAAGVGDRVRWRVRPLAENDDGSTRRAEVLSTRADAR